MSHRPLRSIVAFVCLLAPAVRAEEGDSVAAAQFDKGLADMSAKDFASACPALMESYRLDPRPGTLFTLAECEAKWGKTASAFTHYDEYLQMLTRLPADQRSRQRSRIGIATAQRDALKPAVPMLTLVLPPRAPVGVVVKRDNLTLGAPSLGLSLPVDPGEHIVTVERPDGAIREVRVTLTQGERISLKLEIPDPKPAAPAPPPASTSPATPREKGSHKEWTYTAFGVGAAGLIVGGVTGALVLGKKSAIDAHCTGNVCDAEGKIAGDSASSLATVSTIATGIGLAGAAAGFVLLFTEPQATPSAAARPVLGIRSVVATTGPQGVFFGVRGAW